MTNIQKQLPLARKSDLIVKEMENEVLVYDSRASKAFCLNHSSAIVWKLCDGKTTIAEVTKALRTVDSSVEDSVVWFALQQLESDGLLEKAPVAPANLAGITRKELIKKFGLAAAVIPVVAALVAPKAAKASSTF